MFKIKNKLMGMGGRGGMGGGNGGMGNACYTYTKPTDPVKLEKIVNESNQINFNREVYMGGIIQMDDGIQVNIWGFNGSNTDANGQVVDNINSFNSSFPSPPMRLTQGQLAHTNLTVNMMLRHTIHHHGIEPDFRSDGVGHTSWDVSGNHTYQWRPSSAGTYFYHCHTNTVLHAEMGMYGVLIVDPPEGRNTAFSGGPTYDIEAIWAVDEIDNNWHALAGSGMGANWTAGLCGENTGALQLNDLNPNYFIISGVDATAKRGNNIVSNGNPSANKTTSGIPAEMKTTETLLIRYINAGFMPQQLRIPAALNAKIIASDGHPLPNNSQVPFTKWNTVSAERYDILIENPKPGNYTVEFDILDWETGDVLGVAKTNIDVK